MLNMLTSVCEVPLRLPGSEWTFSVFNENRATPSQLNRR